jgi:alpha-tubulin suppressor-like RCC1 family protein
MILNSPKQVRSIAIIAALLLIAGVVLIYNGITNDNLKFSQAAQNTWLTRGKNSFGTQCNNTTSTVLGVQTYTGLNDAVSVAGGEGHTLIVRADGSVWSSGKNTKGQLGLGTTSRFQTPTQIPGLTNIVKVFAGYDHSFALGSGGELYAWGANSLGQLGLGNNNTTDQLSPVQIFTQNILEVSAGKDHTLFLRNDNAVLASGSNFYGQLGDSGIPNFTATPVLTSLTGNITDISASEYASVAVSNISGEVYTWGSGKYGQLGQGNTNDINTPTAIPLLTGVVYISAGESHMVAVKNDNTILEWGNKDAITQAVHTTSPTAISLAGLQNTLGSPATATFTSFSNDRLGTSRENTYLIDDAGKLVVIGKGTHGQNTVSYEKKITPTLVSLGGGNEFTTTSEVSGDYAFIIDDSVAKEVKVWGYNQDYNLGYTANQQGNREFGTVIQNLSTVASGSNHVLYLQNNGNVFSCGLNYDGQLGLGNNNNAFLPTQISGLTSIVQVAGSESGSFALKNDGQVYAWGNHPTSSTTPQLISGLSNIVDITAGSETLLALNASGELYVYGTNGTEAGVGNTAPTTPVQAATNVRSIACAEESCAYVTFAGAVFTTGSNTSGQLGNGSIGGNQNTFTSNGLSNIQSIFGNHEFAGYNAVSFSNTVSAWGEGMLLAQSGSTVANALPSTIAISDVVELGMYFDAVYARRADGSLWSWSENAPTPVLGVNQITSLPISLPGNQIYLKGDLYEPITNIPALQVSCQVGFATFTVGNITTASTTNCIFTLPSDKRITPSFKLAIGDGPLSGTCTTIGLDVFCNGVVTGSASGVYNDIFASLDGITQTDTLDDVYLDNLDQDGDSLPDSWELNNGLNTTFNDAAYDLDNDGFTNVNEYTYLTDPNLQDTDSDGLLDKDEIDLEFNPNNNNSDSGITTLIDESSSNSTLDGAEDIDNDGFGNALEIISNTDPNNPNDKPAINLVEADIANMTFYCSPAGLNATTICKFNMPLDRLLPPNLQLAIGNGGFSSSVCTLNNSTRLVTCTGVATGSAIGLQQIKVKIDTGSPTNTGEMAAIDLADADSDGLSDTWETQYGLDKDDNGTGDRSNGPIGDNDSDTLTNIEEYFYGTNPIDSDTDNDGLIDGVEVAITKTSPTNSNSDSAKTTVNESTNSINDASEDFDNDGYNNLEEINGNTNPFDFNSRPLTGVDSVFIQQMVFFCDEGLTNSTTTCRSTLPSGKTLTSSLFASIGEAGSSPACVLNDSAITCNNVPTGSATGLQIIYAKLGTNPKINTGTQVRINGVAQTDSDSDGLSDEWETREGLDKNNATGDNGANGDPDGDGVTNIQEYNNDTKPKTADTDGDGVGDGSELLILNTNPKIADSDSSRTQTNEAGNGVNDGAEDFDSDGFTNLVEITASTDPFNANSKPESNFDSLDIPNITIYCQEAFINDTTNCSFTLPSGKFLPPSFKIGIAAGVVPGGVCNVSGSTVTCENVPTGGFEGLQFIYGQINNDTPISSGERVRLKVVNSIDTDGDGLPDEWERTHELNERSADGEDGPNGDSDSDGLTNIQEYNLGTTPRNADTDGDTISDKQELEILKTDPVVGDSDSTLTKDVNEAGNNILDGNEDFDGDKYTNRQELFSGVNPFNVGETPDTGPTGTPIPGLGGSNGTNGNGNNGQVDPTILANLNGTDRTGGLSMSSIIGILLTMVGVTGVVYSILNSRLSIYKTKK